MKDNLKLLVCAWLAFLTLPALALDFEAPIIDPLRSLPTVIATGERLPGDTLSVPCPAVKDFSTPLSLSESVDLSLCNNPQLKATWAAIKVQAGALGETRAAYLPTLTVTPGRMNTATSYTGTPTSTSVSGQTQYDSLSWRLFDFGSREANRKSATSLLTAAIEIHDASIQKTLTSVIQAYFDAQTAKATVTSRAIDEAIARSTLESAQRREKNMEASHSDTLQATTALNKATLVKNRAIGDYQKSLSVLVYAIGVNPNTQLILDDDPNTLHPMDTRTLSDWMAITEKSHPAILAARSKYDAAKQKVISARADGLPTLDFSSTYYRNGYPGQGLSSNPSVVKNVGVSVSIPLFEGFSRTYKIRGAEAQAEQSEADMHDSENSIVLEVVKTYADVVSSFNNLQASADLLGAAKESLSASQRKFDKGAADILEVLNTQSMMADAQQERIQCLSEWRSARLRLLANAGVLGREDTERLK